MKNPLQNRWNPRRAVVITLHYSTEGVSYAAARISGGSPGDFVSFDSLKDLVKKCGKEQPYLIHVSGTGILTRAVENIPNYKEQLIVNGDKDDFYFTTFEAGSRLVTSFFRKALIEDHVNELKNLKAFLLNVSCGIVPCLLHIAEGGKLAFDHEVSIVNGQLENFKRSESVQEQCLVGTRFLSFNEALTESLAMDLKENSPLLTGGFSAEEKRSALQNWVDYSKFRFFGVAMVSTILLLLLGNYFYLNHLNQQVADLEVELALNNENLSLMDRLEQEKIRKEQLILASGINGKSFTSYFIDAIGKTVPSSIKLTEMHVFPLKERLKQKRKVEIDQENIEVLGLTQSSSVLDDWMEKMNRFEWVNRVELLNYMKLTDNQAEFKLVIRIDK
ncbi:MAG: hypothetical protein K0R65_2750 [Crocinitomicaceae bacterium]|jgi:Tfp pilus assembly protein PilN|nr:hypothetical protein [Crocinitomicaceae bacterium]